MRDIRDADDASIHLRIKTQHSSGFCVESLRHMTNTSTININILTIDNSLRI